MIKIYIQALILFAFLFLGNFLLGQSRLAEINPDYINTIIIRTQYYKDVPVYKVTYSRSEIVELVNYLKKIELIKLNPEEKKPDAKKYLYWITLDGLSKLYFFESMVFIERTAYSISPLVISDLYRIYNSMKAEEKLLD